jgi:tripartite-type tricarboxylate transporter receptor subunit TctC
LPLNIESKGGREMETRKGWSVIMIGIVISVIIGISDAVAASVYPTRPIDLVIPYGPGGGTDVTVKLYKDKVEKLLGQPTVMMYKPGAGGVIAGIYVKESKPDGYTFMVISNPSLILSMLTRKADFTLDDFAPVCTITLFPIMFCVKADSPYKTLEDFVQAAKTKKMKYSSTGAYSPGQMYVEAIGRQAGFQAIHVPAGGGAKAMTAVLGGHVELSVCSATGIESQLRVLAVVLQHRAEAYPDVPTLKELGYPIALESYYSLFAPKGTPKEILDRIYGAYRRTLEEDREEITKRAKGIHQVPRVLGPEELGKISQESYVFYKDMISKMGTPVK